MDQNALLKVGSLDAARVDNGTSPAGGAQGVQGAGVSANVLNPDGSQPDGSRDFAGQGVANIASGLLRGMPVGGSVSATSINVNAGARSRQSLILAGIVMAIVVLTLGELACHIAMPALAGLLILIGYRTIKPADLVAVWRTGPVQQAVLTVTFVLTILIPLQFAVLVGVGLSVVLHVPRQSSSLRLSRWELEDDCTILETEPPSHLGEPEIIVLQPYGSLFFAAATQFESVLPTVDEDSRHSVVIVRLRGHDYLGTTFIDVLTRYAQALPVSARSSCSYPPDTAFAASSFATGLSDLIGPDNVYRGRRRLGAAVQNAYADARAWIDTQPSADAVS